MRLRNSLSSCLQTALPSSLHTNMVRRDSKESTRNEKKDWGEMTPEAIQALCLANAPRSLLYRHPILRRFYLVIFVLTTLLFLLPLWSLLYLPRSNRPRRSWTLQRCLRVRWSRRLCGVVARCEIDYLGRDLNLDLVPMRLTHSHPVTIPPAPLYLLQGHPKEMLELLHQSRGSWDPHFIYRANRAATDVWGAWNSRDEKELSKEYGFEAVKAFWFAGEKGAPDEKPKPRQDGDPVMLHFHGGGYLCGTAAETDLTSSICKALVNYSPIHHILSVDYRLAPVGPWPLPLLDAISAYHYLVMIEGIAEQDIIIGGDSAGGHLAMALTRWLRDEGNHVGLSMPRGVVLMSPWADLGFTNAWGAEEYKYNADSDTIDDTFGPFACSLLLRALPLSILYSSPYLSPASSTVSATSIFNNFPPTYIVYGGAERLAKSTETLYSRIQLARRAADKVHVPDRLFASPDAVHDFMIFPWMAREASQVYEDLDKWLRGLLTTDICSPEAASKDSLKQSKEITDQRRLTRQRTLESFRSHKSPRMCAAPDSGMLELVQDMQEEGMSMIEIPKLDLGSTAFAEI
ncbi:endoplasmic reticulum protein [Cryptococcus neoformans]|nr:endoplasmic reticulum protein [Cryptococcus neoformans var. grubii]